MKLKLIGGGRRKLEENALESIFDGSGSFYEHLRKLDELNARRADLRLAAQSSGPEYPAGESASSTGFLSLSSCITMDTGGCDD